MPEFRLAGFVNFNDVGMVQRGQRLKLTGQRQALLHRGGTLLLVQSEFADVTRTLNALKDNGLQARVVARQRIPFGPVLHRRAEWLEQLGLLRPGRRTETLAVVAARRR